MSAYGGGAVHRLRDDGPTCTDPQHLEVRHAYWVVLDYAGNRLPGSWPTESAAVDEGLCGRYLLSGHEVVRVWEL